MRSLGRRGVPVCVIDDEHSIARFSRYTTHSVARRRLPRRASRRSRSCCDSAAVSASTDGCSTRRARRPWRRSPVTASAAPERFRVPTPDWDTVRWAWDKRNTYRLAEQLGIPTPRTWYPAASTSWQRSTLTAAGDQAGDQGALHLRDEGQGLAGRHARRARRALRRAAAHGRAGRGDGSGADPRRRRAAVRLLRVLQGRPARSASMVARRRRQHPPEFGRASTFVETIELPLLEALSERFLQAIDYYGLVELEYKLDPRDGHYKLLDVNARTWGYHTLGSAPASTSRPCSSPTSSAQPSSRAAGRAGVSWVRLRRRTCRPASLEIVGGRLDWRAYLRSLRRRPGRGGLQPRRSVAGAGGAALIPYLAVEAGLLSHAQDCAAPRRRCSHCYGAAAGLEVAARRARASRRHRRPCALARALLVASSARVDRSRVLDRGRLRSGCSRSRRVALLAYRFYRDPERRRRSATTRW